MLRTRLSTLSRTFATQVSAPSTSLKSTSPPGAPAVRNTWTKQEVQEIYETPLLELVWKAAAVHRQFNDPSKIQLCTLMNIKSEFLSCLSISNIEYIISIQLVVVLKIVCLRPGS